jgi:hypothetical protein
MKIHNCQKCKEYKYIEKDGLCKDCYDENKDYTPPTKKHIISKSKSRSNSVIPLNRFDNNKIPLTGRCIIGSFNRSINIQSGIEMLRMKKEYQNINLYCIDNSGILSKFVNALSGKIYQTNTMKKSNLLNPNYIDINNTESLCFDIRNDKFNGKTMPDLLEMLSENSSQNTLIYFDIHNTDYKIEEVIRHSRHYNTSINLIYTEFPPKNVSVCPITRVHSVRDSLLSKKLTKRLKAMEKRHITKNSRNYPTTYTPNVLIKKPFENNYRTKKFSISADERKIIKSI